MRYFLILIVSFVFFNACKEKTVNSTTDSKKGAAVSVNKEKPSMKLNTELQKNSGEIEKVTNNNDKIAAPGVKEKLMSLDKKSEFKEISSDSGIAIDIRYATKNNFTKKQIYPCGKCYLRPDAAQAIEKAHQILKAKHYYGLKVFDCYRPRPAQQRLWDVVPNPDYVTPPAKGSMHNRGLAVDLTIVDAKGKDLEMGTPYDFFGKEAHTDNLSLPANVLRNRQLLTSVLKEVGFSGIRTEWWHFSFDSNGALSDWEWPCN